MRRAGDFLLVLVLAALPRVVGAQITTGTILGTVTDASGVPLAAATISSTAARRWRLPVASVMRGAAVSFSAGPVGPPPPDALGVSSASHK